MSLACHNTENKLYLQKLSFKFVYFQGRQGNPKTLFLLTSKSCPNETNGLKSSESS